MSGATCDRCGRSPDRCPCAQLDRIGEILREHEDMERWEDFWARLRKEYEDVAARLDGRPREATA